MKKKIAIYLAFIQLFIGGAIAKGESNNFHLVSNLSGYRDTIEIEDNNDKIVTCRRVDKDTQEESVISIFDDENIKSSQYGASQRVFKRDFDELIKDPVIWNMMQEYYPVDSFDCLDDAMFFYKKYFEIIYECGCGYAAAADYVFHYFEGREEDFYKAFRYPMYTFIDGKIDFNYEPFMLEFFNYSNLFMNDERETINSYILKDLYEEQLYRFTRDRSYDKEYRGRINSLNDEEFEAYQKLQKEHDEKFKELNERYKNTPKLKEINLGIYLDGRFGYLYSFLALHGISSDSSYQEDVRSYNSDDIMACEKFTLYKIKTDGTLEEAHDYNGLHYMYVIGNDKDGNMIVSTWGGKYILNYKQAKETYLIKLKAH